MLMLKEMEYNEMQVLDRLRALEAVVHGVLMGETVRRRIETNIETRDLMRKQLWQDVLENRKRLREEAVAVAQPGIEHIPTEYDEDGNPIDKDDGDNHNSPGKDKDMRYQSRQDLIRQMEAEHPIRVEPLGTDRRYNRYFKFGGLEELGDKPLLLVEGGEGDSWRTVLTQSQLKDLHASLNPRGQRECGLEASLRRHLEAVQKDKDRASARGEAAEEDADEDAVVEGGDLSQRSMVLAMAERTAEATTAAQTRIQEHKLIKVKGKKRARIQAAIDLLTAPPPKGEEHMHERDMEWL